METLRQRLEKYSPIFLDHRRRVERTGGLDALLNGQWRVVEGRMNTLLEKFFDEFSEIEFIGITDSIEPIDPAIEVEHGLGVE